MKPKDSSPRRALEDAKHVALEPDAERARAIVSYLQTAAPSSTEVFDAFWQLDALPVNHVRDALAAWVGPLPDLEHLDPALRHAHGLPPRALRLRTLSIARDADVLDLGPLAEAQLRIAGTTWDALDLAPEDRLDGELEGSFAGTLERRVLADAADATATPLFDVLLFAEDAGVVFAAGTTTVTALIAYRKVETRDRRTRTAIEEALAAMDAPAAEEAPVVATTGTPEEERPRTTEPEPTATRSTAAKKVAPRKAPPTEVATRKAPAKRVASKKAPAKKVAPKKAPAKKVAPKKAAAKKVAPKKAPAKKATAKKAPAKKAPAKKTPAKKTAKARTPSREATARTSKKGARVARR